MSIIDADLLQSINASVEKAAADWMAAQADGQKVLVVARAICIADGFDPEMIVMGYPHSVVLRGAKGTTGLMGPFQPTWALYWREALAALAASKDTQE